MRISYWSSDVCSSGLLRGSVRGIDVYDDFAHHPTAIATTLAGLRRQLGSRRILAVLEPRSNTMKLGAMAARLPEALDAADLVFCFGASQGKHALGWDPAQILAQLDKRATPYPDLAKMLEARTEERRVGKEWVRT